MAGERGSIAIPMVAICMGCVVVTALVFTLFAGLLARQIGNTVADSAALGALQAFNEGMPEAFDKALAPKVAAFEAAVAKELQRRQDARTRVCVEVSKAFPKLAAAACKPLTPEEARAERFDVCTGQFGAFSYSGGFFDEAYTLPLLARRFCEARENGTDFPRVDLVKSFLTPEERGCVLLVPDQVLMDKMRQRAADFSQTNGGPASVQMVYPTDGAPVITVNFRQPVRYLLLVKDGLPAGFQGIESQAAAGVSLFAQLEAAQPADLKKCAEAG